MSYLDRDFSTAHMWSIKHRPQTIEECILPKSTKDRFKDIIRSGKIPNLMLVSAIPGTGKTTSALALCRELDADVLFINASLDNSINNIRTDVIGFCSTMSMTQKRKVVFLDECDQLSSDAILSLRGVMEQYPNTSFIFTCNYIQKIPDPIKSRCSVVEYKISPTEERDIKLKFIEATFKVLDKEVISYDKKAIVLFLHKFYPDFRKTLNELQNVCIDGKITAETIEQASSSKIDSLLLHIKAKDFFECRQWVANCKDLTILYSKLYEEMYPLLEQSCISEFIIILAKYQHMSSSVVDQQLNASACILELLNCVAFK